jgi:hypothetical protein
MNIYLAQAGVHAPLDELSDEELNFEYHRLEDIMDSPEQDYEYLMALQLVVAEMKVRGIYRG